MADRALFPEMARSFLPGLRDVVVGIHVGDKLFPHAPDLTQPRTQQLSDGELHHIISEGIRLTGMPAMGEHERPDEIWKLVALVRKLPDLNEAQMARAAGLREDTAPQREGVGTAGSER